jgi:hypothetical protein
MMLFGEARPSSTDGVCGLIITKISLPAINMSAPASSKVLEAHS